MAAQRAILAFHRSVGGLSKMNVKFLRQCYCSEFHYGGDHITINFSDLKNVHQDLELQ